MKILLLLFAHATGPAPDTAWIRAAYDSSNVVMLATFEAAEVDVVMAEAKQVFKGSIFQTNGIDFQVPGSVYADETYLVFARFAEQQPRRAHRVPSTHCLHSGSA